MCDELTAQRDRIQEQLGDALERLAAAFAEERDRLRTEVEQFESTLAEAQAAAAAERERLLGDVDRLESVLAETRAAHEKELGGLRDELARRGRELEGLQTALAESQASTAEQERVSPRSGNCTAPSGASSTPSASGSRRSSATRSSGSRSSVPPPRSATSFASRPSGSRQRSPRRRRALRPSCAVSSRNVTA